MQIKVIAVLPMLVLMGTLICLTRGLGNGCEWSGCGIHTGHCGTGVTGGSGRSQYIRSTGCGWFQKRQYCCAEDCGHRACGRSCAGLGMSGAEVDPVDCMVPLPGTDIEIPAKSNFCCVIGSGK